FRTNGNVDRMAIDAAGNVGIGTDSPGRSLDVVGRIRLRQDVPAASGNTAGIDFYQQTPAVDRAFIGMRTDDPCGLYGGGGAGSRFLMNGNSENMATGPAARLYPPHLVSSATTDPAGSFERSSTNSSPVLNFSSAGSGPAIRCSGSNGADGIQGSADGTG